MMNANCNFPFGSRMVTVAFAAILLALFFVSPVNAASFDCAKAATPVEKLICGDAALSKLDDQLGTVYADLKANLDGNKLKSLRKQQSAWLSTRNACRDVSCLSGLYQGRIEGLNRQLLESQYAGQAMEILSVLEQTYDNAASITVRFSVPVDSRTDFRRYLKVMAHGNSLPSENWLLTDDGLLAVYPFVDPNTTYAVHIKPGIKGINGKTQAANRQEAIKTRRSKPSASFASNGYVMSTRLKRALPVVTLNVDQVDIDVFRIAPDKIAKWVKFTDNQQRYHNRLNAFAKDNPLVFTGRYPIGHQRNQRTTTNLDLSDVAALNTPGAYLAVLRVPGRYAYYYDINLFTVSDIGLQVRKSADALHVLAHSIVTGAPLPQIEISLHDKQDLEAQLPTDANGIASFALDISGVRTVTARQGDQYTILRLRKPLDFSGLRNAITHHRDTQVFAWGPRDLYRPGETVTTLALLRDVDGRRVRSAPIAVALIDATGARISNTTVNPGDHGAYAYTHTLSDSAKTGSWKLVYRIPGNEDILHEYGFQVEDFLPERLNVTVFDGDPDKRRRVSGEELTIPINGKYLYGAPASGNKADGMVVAELDRHPFEQWKSYSFGISREKVRPRRSALDDIELDEDGNGHWDVDLDPWEDVQSPLALTTTASVYESGGRPVTRSISVTRILQDRLVGIEPQFDERPDNNSRPDFKLILTDRDGRQAAGKGYQFTLIREDRNYYWTYAENGGWRWEYDPMEYAAFSSRVRFNAKGSVSVSAPVKWGNYRVEVADASGTLVSSYRFRTRWYWWGNEDSGTAMRPDQVRMTFTSETYLPGETARLRLTPPTDGVATLTVESNDAILWVRHQPVASAGTDIDIPIAEDWRRHDLVVTATVLAPGDMAHSVAPKRSFGFIHLPIKRPDAEFRVRIDVPEKTEPRREVTATVTVTGASAAVGATYVTLAAVDVGVLNITRYATPDPAGYLYGARRYDVSYYDVYGRIIENAGFDYSRHRFGGGFAASMAELARGGDKPESDVKILAWQSQPVKVGADGTVKIPMLLPEFNGKVRWMAVAYADQTYGHADAETTVADRIVVQLSKPRFMAVGDRSELSLDLSNQSGADLRLKVALTASGALNGDRWVRTLGVDDTQKTTLRFPVQMDRLGKGDLRLTVTGEASGITPITLNREWFIGSRSAYPAVTRKAQTILHAGESWRPTVPVDDLRKEGLQAQLILSNTPPIDASSHFGYLLRYPYGCTEQSTSSGYPWVLVDPNAAQQMGLMPLIKQRFKKPFDDAFRKIQIETAVKRVLRSQKTNGGFGLWSADASEGNWLTAYVADFLTDARLAGADVPSPALKKALDRLQKYVTGQVSISPRWSRDSGYYAFATRAYAAYVLAKVNRLRLSHLRRFYDEEKKRTARSALPWVHLGYAFDMLGDQRRAKAAYIAAEKTTYAEGYYGTYGSALRDLSLSYAILLKRGRGTIDQLLEIFNLAKRRQWLSTQERNALFKAARAALAQGEEKLRAAIYTSGFTQKLEQDTAFNTILDYDQLASIDRIEALDGVIYASLEVVGHTVSAPKPFGNGFAIDRDVFDMDGARTAMSSLDSGDLVIVRLRVSAKQRTPDGLVVDLLPAGLELENQNLGNASVDLSKVVIDGEGIESWQDEADVVHMEFRDDRFVAALALSRPGRVHTLYYLARAVTPGRYQVPQPYVEDMYRPYYQAIGDDGGLVEIKP